MKEQILAALLATLTLGANATGPDVPGSDVPGSDVPGSDVPGSDVTGETRLPDTLTEAERADMIAAANAYGECLVAEAGLREAEPDPRAIADAAMGACNGRLEALQSLLTGLRLDAGYAEAFRRQTRDRSARRLLGMLMQMKGQAQ